MPAKQSDTPNLKRTATMRDVAAQAGVSVSTVSLVISGRKHGKSRISKETQERIFKAIKDLNYVPSQQGRQLRKQASERICVILPTLGRPYDDSLLKDVKSAANANNYSVIVNISETPAQVKSILQQLRAGLADAFILSTGYHHRQNTDLHDELNALATANIPGVILSNYYNSNYHDVFVTTEYDCSYEAVSYLLKNHKRVAFIGHTHDNVHAYQQYLDNQHAPKQTRYEAYLHALIDHNIPIDPDLLTEGADTHAHAFETVSALLTQPEPPTALYCASDIAAISALSAAHTAGLRIPGDIAIIGTGNIPEAEVSYPPLSTIGPLERDFKDVANKLFSHLLHDPHRAGTQVTQKWSLFIRGTT